MWERSRCRDGRDAEVPPTFTSDVFHRGEQAIPLLEKTEGAERSGATFDFIARLYRLLESIAFQNSLQRARTFFLDQIPTPERVLVAGEGNGRFLREFVRRFPKARIDCVDASARMLELARAKLPDANHSVRFIRNDLLAWSPEEDAYDLIVTHFFLDCFDEHELAKVVAALAKSATQNALWLLADFSIPRQPLRKLHAQTWLWVMHRFFRVVARISARRLIDPLPFMSAHGFRCAQNKYSRLGLVKSELWRR